MYRLLLITALVLLGIIPDAYAFSHERWDTLLQAHVQVIDGGKSTQVDYRGLGSEREKLSQYLSQLALVKQQEFDSWSKEEQLAFLINSYNAWTVELVLTRYPDLDSIKDLGSFFQSPWKRVFIPLLGKDRSLDDIEHGLIRGSGRYNDPRIHFAVNCASIGCPALRNEAYTGENLEMQLQEATHHFLRDTTRNRLEGTTLKISSIFKWYREDFEKGWHGAATLEEFLLLYAESLSLDTRQQLSLKEKEIRITFLDYDWGINDFK